MFEEKSVAEKRQYRLPDYKWFTMGAIWTRAEDNDWEYSLDETFSYIPEKVLIVCLSNFEKTPSNATEKLGDIRCKIHFFWKDDEGKIHQPSITDGGVFDVYLKDFFPGIKDINFDGFMEKDTYEGNKLAVSEIRDLVMNQYRYDCDDGKTMFWTVDASEWFDFCYETAENLRNSQRKDILRSMATIAYLQDPDIKKAFEKEAKYFLEPLCISGALGGFVLQISDDNEGSIASSYISGDSSYEMFTVPTDMFNGIARLKIFNFANFIWIVEGDEDDKYCEFQDIAHCVLNGISTLNITFNNVQRIYLDNVNSNNCIITNPQSIKEIKNSNITNLEIKCTDISETINDKTVNKKRKVDNVKILGGQVGLNMSNFDIATIEIENIRFEEFKLKCVEVLEKCKIQAIFNKAPRLIQTIFPTATSFNNSRFLEKGSDAHLEYTHMSALMGKVNNHIEQTRFAEKALETEKDLDHMDCSSKITSYVYGGLFNYGRGLSVPLLMLIFLWLVCALQNWFMVWEQGIFQWMWFNADFGESFQRSTPFALLGMSGVENSEWYHTLQSLISTGLWFMILLAVRNNFKIRWD